MRIAAGAVERGIEDHAVLEVHAQAAIEGRSRPILVDEVKERLPVLDERRVSPAMLYEDPATVR